METILLYVGYIGQYLLNREENFKSKKCMIDSDKIIISYGKKAMKKLHFAVRRGNDTVL